MQNYTFESICDRIKETYFPTETTVSADCIVGYNGLVNRSEYGWQIFKSDPGVCPVIDLNSRMRCDWSEYPLAAAMSA